MLKDTKHHVILPLANQKREHVYSHSKVSLFQNDSEGVTLTYKQIVHTEELAVTDGVANVFLSAEFAREAEHSDVICRVLKYCLAKHSFAYSHSMLLQ